MPGIREFLFGSGPLKKAAGDSPKSEKRESAGIDIGKLAQDSADRAKSSEAANPKPSGKSPLSSPMSPHKKGK